MSVLNFPSNPAVNQIYTFGDYSYKFDGEKWTSFATTPDGGVFDSVAAMVAAELVAGVQYSTKGYATPGDGGAATYIGQAAGAPFDGHVNHESASGVVANLIPTGGWLRTAQCGVTSGDSTAALQAMAAHPINRYVFDTDTIAAAPIAFADGVFINLNGHEIFCNHDLGFTASTGLAPLDGAVIFGKGALRSRNGIDGFYIEGNTALPIRNSVIVDVHLESWGEDAISAKGNCFCDRITFDDIRDNPYRTSGNNNYLGSIVGGNCGGDFILLKGGGNVVMSAVADDVGWRTDSANFTAGSGFVIGADGDDATDNHIAYGRVKTWGALLVATEGNDNTVGTIVGGDCYYTAGFYPKAGVLTGKCELVNLGKSRNTIDSITCDTTPRGIGIGGTGASYNKVKRCKIGSVLVGNLINIDRSDNVGNSIDYIECNSVPNAGCIRNYGTNTRLGEVVVRSGNGGGANAGTMPGTGLRIGFLDYTCNFANSSGNGFLLTGVGFEIQKVRIVGFQGFCMHIKSDGNIGEFDLRTYSGAYDNMLIVDGADLKMNLVGGRTFDGSGTSFPPRATNGAVVNYAYNVGPNMVSSSGATVVNTGNIA